MSASEGYWPYSPTKAKAARPHVEKLITLLRFAVGAEALRAEGSLGLTALPLSMRGTTLAFRAGI
jgi:hypothetical protein